jgi:hypothetical protein
MKTIIVLLSILLVALGSHAQVPQESAGTQWRLTSSRSYEESSPGLGTSQHFSSGYGWIDVFSYGLKRNDWRNGTTDPQFDSQFAEALANVRRAAAEGITSNLVMGPARDVRLAASHFELPASVSCSEASRPTQLFT